MTRVRWTILAAGALGACLWCGGCSKAPRRASADEAKRTGGAAGPPVARVEPAPVYPSVTGRDAGADFTAAIRQLNPPGGGEADLVAGPWAGAAVGRFVTYRGAGGVRLTHKVVAVDAEGVTVETSTSLGGSRRSRHPLRVPAHEGEGGVPVTAQWESRDLEVGGQRLSCRVATWMARYGSRQSVRRVWLCDRVPGRLVRSERGDGSGGMTVVLELVALGG